MPSVPADQLSVDRRRTVAAEIVAMNPLLAYQREGIVETPRPDRCVGLGCAGALRVAAATLSRSRSELVTATTVVHLLGQDDVLAIEALVADIADEFGLDSGLRVHGSSFSVRFSRREPPEGSTRPRRVRDRQTD
jgi:hypothetical protein